MAISYDKVTADYRCSATMDGVFIVRDVNGTATRLYNTGDLAVQQPDGTYLLIGRTDNQVKIDGVRVDLLEIEAVVEQSGIAARCVCVHNQNQLLAAVELAASEDWTHLRGEAVFAITRHCTRQLPARLVPSHIVVVDAGMPLSPNGKVDRIAVHRMLQEHQHQLKLQAQMAGTDDAVMTATEVFVQRAWSAGLNIPPSEIKRGCHFFDMGGDSILALKTVSKLVKTPPFQLDEGTVEARRGLIEGMFAPRELMMRPIFSDYHTFLCQHRTFTVRFDGVDAGSSRDGATAGDVPMVNTSTEHEIVTSTMDDPLMSIEAFDAVDSGIPIKGDAITEAVNRAATYGNVALLTLLHDIGASVDNGMDTRTLGLRPLHFAVMHSHLRVVEWLVSHGASVTARTSSLISAVHMAASLPSADILQLLIRHAAPVLCKDNREQTPLFYAARSNRLQCMHAILTQPGLDCDRFDRWKRTPYTWAVLNGHVDAAQALLHAGACVNGPSMSLVFHHRGTHLLLEKPIHLACRLRGATAIDMMRLLMEHRADVNIKAGSAVIIVVVVMSKSPPAERAGPECTASHMQPDHA